MHKTIYFAGGCFWGMEKFFSLIPGVTRTETGYANGSTENPTYQQVCHENTGHAETVLVEYDAERVSLWQLLWKFFGAINVTAINRQGPDVGAQYRSGIYYADAAALPVIRKAVEALQGQTAGKVAIEVLPLAGYFPAESYHQHYLDKNPGGYCHISPAKMEQAKEMAEPTKSLKARLSPMQFHVTQESGTEPPFQNEYWEEFRPGIYVDIVSGKPLFVSAEKFESGCGWPSFARPIDSAQIVELDDHSLGRHRIEVRAKESNTHLGHVFPDGPEAMGGLCYCINSAALRFIPKADMEKEGYGALLTLVEERGAEQ